MTERLDCAALARDVSARGTPAETLAGVDALVARAVAEIPPQAVLLVMSNGDFGGIHQRLLDALPAGAGTGSQLAS
ncbi:MAG: hypothetical protein HRU02_12675 [Myxococcales bacterium]|nr:hypothetical protein [Myxococcales bacterium]